MSQLENALVALHRGFQVFPCYPRTKKPAGEIVPNGVKQATTDERQVRIWWAYNPDYNPAVTGGVIVDCDSGLGGLHEALTFAKLNGLPNTLVVRTGRRTSYGAQFHFAGTTENRPYTANGVTGEVRCRNQYGMAPGAIHPDTGERYEIVIDLPRAPWPAAAILGGRVRKFAPRDPGEEITTTTEGARETFVNLLYEARHAKAGFRNHSAHAVTWFAARAFLAGVFNATSEEIGKQIFEAVNPHYRLGERDVSRMLRDSWRYGLAAGRLRLELYASDFVCLKKLSDDLRFQRSWDGDTSDFPCATDAKEYMRSVLEEAGCEEVERVLKASRINEAVANQLSVELKIAELLESK